MPSPTILWYFADPMCSWCWGFSPVIEAIRRTYGERLKIALMLGGLRPGTTEPISDQTREEILHHWCEVHKLTGQVFNFENALPDGFIYDTEPACRAVISVAELKPDRIFTYFKSIQSAFYVEQIDVSREDKLAELVTQQGLTADEFIAHFHSEAANRKPDSIFRGHNGPG